MSRLFPRIIPRNPLSGVHVGWFLAAAVVPCAYLGLPVWVWPLPLFAVYVLHVLMAPYAPCRRCDGDKKTKVGKGTRSYGKCRKCGGSGERLRWKSLRSTGKGGAGGLSL